MPAPRVGDPTPPIFHLLPLGVGVFRYQLVGIPDAKLWHLGSKPTRGPNANGFASQWNTGFGIKTISVFCKYLYVFLNGAVK